jgi:sulfhydrogenase subunit beta (sulfur reductase)
MNARQIKLLPRSDLDRLLATLRQLDFSLIGPRKRDEAIVYGEIESVADLPVGLQDEQEGGGYRLQQTGDESLFSYVVGPNSWKEHLFPPRETLFIAKRENGKLVFDPSVAKTEKRAFIGVRSCDLHAIAIQDRVFLGEDFTDPGYARRRDNLFIVAVNCTRAARTCFCVSVNTGPKATVGFDLALTEVLKDGEHYFTLEVGSEIGEQVIASLDLADADAMQLGSATTANARATQQTRTLNSDGLKELIYANLENDAYWADVAGRCLDCANCTLVCPTCFCSNVEEVTDLAGASTERVRHWDSCFNLSHSHIAGGSVRKSGDSRYRQWLTHKLASWQDQFDTLGCVGCGRCISWCPVGIDIAAEAKRLQDSIGIAK